MASPSIWAPPPGESSRNWVELPAELTSSILVRLGTVEVLMSARRVCKTWRQICSDPDMWRVVDIRSSQLGCLYLSSSIKIMSEGLSKMLKRLPLLEELHLDCACNLKKAIEIAGRCCPQLKSLKLINTLYRHPKMGCDEDALAIAKNMPGLRHLRLYGPNKITNDGLLAILENCPHLESLDVWHCVANVRPDLVRRLSQQIKDLTLSYDSSQPFDGDLDYLDYMDFLNYELSAINIDDLDSLDEDDFSELSDTNTVSDEYDDSEFSGGSD